jgi:hypothetical protein
LPERSTTATRPTRARDVLARQERHGRDAACMPENAQYTHRLDAPQHPWPPFLRLELPRRTMNPTDILASLTRGRRHRRRPHPPPLPRSTSRPPDQLWHRLVSRSPPGEPPGTAEQDAALAYPSSSPEHTRHGRHCRSTSVPFRHYKYRPPLIDFFTPPCSPHRTRPPRPPPLLDSSP